MFKTWFVICILQASLKTCFIFRNDLCVFYTKRFSVREKGFPSVFYTKRWLCSFTYLYSVGITDSHYGTYLLMFTHNYSITIVCCCDMYFTGISENMVHISQHIFHISMSRLEQRWRAQRSVISIANCRIPWTNRDLNVYCAFGISLKACLLQCLFLFIPSAQACLICVFPQKRDLSMAFFDIYIYIYICIRLQAESDPPPPNGMVPACAGPHPHNACKVSSIRS